MTDRTCQKWFAVSVWRFLSGRCSTVGRPVEVDSNQIETLVENNQLYTTQGIADILKLSKSIKLLVKMKNMYFAGKKPHELFGQPNICLTSK